MAEERVLSFFCTKLVPSKEGKKPLLYLKHSYGGKQADELSVSEASLIAFCFPLGAEAVVPKEFMASEEYTFTLTGGDGKRYHGFCRKFLPPKPAVGHRAQLPQVLCLVSEDPWATFYFKVLQVLEQMVKLGGGSGGSGGAGGEGSLLQSEPKHLPSSSCAAAFLQDLVKQLELNPRPSEIVRVPLPKAMDMTGLSPHRLLGAPLNFAEECLELQVPIDCGNGRWNCGVSLARLLWDVPVPALTSLLASMLLERRIILVSSQRDTVTAAVQAASALLYPFKWHHIYLPMLPQAFKDYLSAPMPFMVGLQSQMLHMLSAIPMDEIRVVDLDIHSCQPPPGSPHDDARILPWREQLEAALTAVHKVIRSPTEHETSPLIASILQEFFVRLFGGYRRFIHADTPQLNARWAAHVAAALQQPPPPSSSLPASASSSSLVGTASGGSALGGALHSPRMHRESSSGRPLSALDASGHGGPALGRGSTHNGAFGGGAGGGGLNPADHVIKAAGFVFEHTAFVLSHRRNDKARLFLSQLRGSQLYAMFVQERLEAAAAAAAGGAHGVLEEPFELRVDLYQERRRARFAKLRAARGSGNVIMGKWANLMRRHRRSDSEEAAIIGGGGAGGLGGSAPARDAPLQSGGLGAAGAGGKDGLGAAVMEAAAGVAGAAAGVAGAAASALRRIAEKASDTLGPSSGLSGQQAQQHADAHPHIDPASFFLDDDDDYEDLVQESRAAAGDPRAMSASSASPSHAAHVDRTAHSFAVPSSHYQQQYADAAASGRPHPPTYHQGGGGSSAAPSAQQPPGRGGGGGSDGPLSSAQHRLATVSAAMGSLLPSRFSAASQSQPDVTRLMQMQPPSGAEGAGAGGAGAGPGSAPPPALARGSTGVTVTVGPDGHKVYEGKLGSILRSAVTELTGALGRRSTASALTPGAPPTSSSSLTTPSSPLHTSPPQPQGASSSAAGLYRPQLTGGDAAGPSGRSGSNPRFTAQSSGGLLDVVANGRLKPPPSSTRPLLPAAAADGGGPASPGGQLQPPVVVVGGEAASHQQHQADAAAASHQPQQLPLPPMPAVNATPAGRAASNGSGPQQQQQRGGKQAPLLDGFDGFAELASAHSPPAPTPGAHPGKSLLDL